MNDIKIINDLYDNPQKISKDNFLLIEQFLYKYKDEIIEDKYYLYVAKNDIITKLFILYLFYYNYNINKNTKIKYHVAIDCEFNVKKIALMQLNFGKHIWIIKPDKYDNIKIEIFNNLLLLNNKIYKVFHGSDSLDLPYIFSDLLEQNKQKILIFTKKLIDTRFLCEYVRISKKEEGKCSIYDAMKYFGTINEEKYSELIEINASMGPVQDVTWDIDKLSSFHIKYAYYDVLYLNDFLKDIYKKIIKETPEYVRSYYYIIEIIRLVILERKNITTIVELSKNVVNPINNYLIKHKDDNYTLINIYNQVIKNFSITEKQKGSISFEFIESLNYVRGTFSFFLKHLTYNLISKNYKIYKNRKEPMKEKINIDSLFEELKNIKFYKIIKLLNLFKKEMNIKIKNLFETK